MSNEEQRKVDQKRVESQLILLTKYIELRWQVLITVSTIVVGVVALLGQNNFLGPSWLVYLILFFALASIPIIVFIYEKVLRKSEVGSLKVIRQILNEYDPDANKQVDGMLGGWESMFPQRCIFF